MYTVYINTRLSSRFRDTLFRIHLKRGFRVFEGGVFWGGRVHHQRPNRGPRSVQWVTLLRFSTRCHTCSPCPTITRRSCGMDGFKQMHAEPDSFTQAASWPPWVFLVSCSAAVTLTSEIAMHSQERSQLHYFHYLLLLKAGLPNIAEIWQLRTALASNSQYKTGFSDCWDTLLNICRKWERRLIELQTTPLQFAVLDT